MFTSQAARAQTVLFRDDFNTPGSVNPSQWIVFGENLMYGRTQFGNQPVVVGDPDGTAFARLKLSTYNPSQSPTFPIKGSEMSSQLFPRAGGKEFEARVRNPNLAPGIVSAFWAYGKRGEFNTPSYESDEIDFEFLSNSPRDRLQFATWNDWNPFFGTPYNNGINHRETTLPVSGLNWTGWNTYKIRWLPDHTEWYVNNILVHSSTEALPDEPLSVRFNIWAPASDWTAAYNAGLAPTGDPAQNQEYFLDVDWVEVRNIGQPPATGGSGLTATYFDNQDLTNPAMMRLDPSVDFNWAGGSPEVGMGADTFSVRWTGDVQPQFSETYTFFTNTDDGVRLWINDQLLIDQWVNQGPTEYSASVNLVAGRRYSIKMEYFEASGGASAQLLWQSSSTPKQIIPPDRLFPTTTPPDTTPPTITFTSPANGATVPTLATISGTAPDNPGGSGLREVQLTIQRYSDGLFWNGSGWMPFSAATILTTTVNAATGSFTYNSGPSGANLQNGPYRLQATAVDNANNPAGNAIAANIQQTDTIPPAPSFTSPSNGQTVSSLSTINGTAPDNPGGSGLRNVQLLIFRYSDGAYWNGSNWIPYGPGAILNAAVNTAAGTWSYNSGPGGANLPNGPYRLQMTAFDHANNAAGTAIAISIEQTDAIPPSPSFTSPSSGQTASSLSTISGTAPDNAGGSGLRNVQLLIFRYSDGAYWNGSSWVAYGPGAILNAAVNTAAGTWSYNSGPGGANLQNGPYRLQVTAFDNAGNGAINAIGINVQKPTEPTYRVAGRITLSNGGAASGISVSLQDRSGNIFTTTTDNAGNYVFPDVVAGNFLVRPLSETQVFSPSTRFYTLTNADVSGLDFVASPRG